MPTCVAHKPILDWYAAHARALPWRRDGVGAWQVMVSEVMLQQTQVTRVLPAYDAWVVRWPTPAALASESPGEAVRMWGSLGYPRRALRLHQAATVIDECYGGVVPATYDELRALPGIGDYTAAAVYSFAHRQRAAVLDTNVRRVLSRLFSGVEFPTASPARAERDLAESVLPDNPEAAARWSVAVMELGALVCSARTPRCGGCPVAALCAWRLNGYPAFEGAPRPSQTYSGTDRQCRGRILALLRESQHRVRYDELIPLWPSSDQLERALASLLDDGLVVQRDSGTLDLP